jgi:uncharacterized protein YbaR (Trm112 family)
MASANKLRVFRGCRSAASRLRGLPENRERILSQDALFHATPATTMLVGHDSNPRHRPKGSSTTIRTCNGTSVLASKASPAGDLLDEARTAVGANCECLRDNTNVWKRFSEVLRCPACSGDLELVVLEERQSALEPGFLGLAEKNGIQRPDFSTYVEAGLLVCAPCKVRYPIAHGLPLMLPYSTRLHEEFDVRW